MRYIVHPVDFAETPRVENRLSMQDDLHIEEEKGGVIDRRGMLESIFFIERKDGEDVLANFS